MCWRRVRGRLAVDGTAPTAARVAALVREEVGLRGAAAGTRRGRVGATVSSSGPARSTSCCTSPASPTFWSTVPDEVWVDRGRGLERAEEVRRRERLRRLAVRLAAAAGRRLDDAVPCADIRLADGVRLHAVLPPVSPRICLSFRVPRRRAFSLAELVSLGTVTAAGAASARRVVRARLSFIVTGGTGTGKTTLLSTLLGCADPPSVW